MLYREALGDVIRQLRLERKWTLRKLSKKAPIALGYLSELENGRKEASSEVVENLAKGLGISVAELVIEVAFRLGGFDFDKQLAELNRQALVRR